MKRFAILFIAAIAATPSYGNGNQGHYTVNDSAVITNDAVAEANCSKETLQLYRVNKSTCLPAAKKCLAELEKNKIDVEANPMHHLNCMMKTLNLTMNDLMKK